jgi:alpha-L-arabinofuranosidase
VGSSLTGAGERFFYSATASPGKLCLKLVNATSSEQPLTIRLRGVRGAGRIAHVATLHGNTVWATNTISDPKQIVPVHSMVKLRGERTPYVVAPYSIQLLEVDLK